MTGALMIRWAGVVRGREAKALEVFSESQAYWDELAKQGRIHDHTAYFPLIGDGGGFVLVTGEAAELAVLQTEERSRALLMKASMIVEGLTTSVYAGGTEATINELMGRTIQIEQEMGYFG